MIGDRIEVNIAGGLDVDLPRMVRVRQKFRTPTEDDVAATVIEQLHNSITRRSEAGYRRSHLSGLRRRGGRTNCLEGNARQLCLRPDGGQHR